MEILELILGMVIVLISTGGIIVCARLGAEALFGETNKRNK